MYGEQAGDTPSFVVVNGGLRRLDLGQRSGPGSMGLFGDGTGTGGYGAAA